MVVFKKKNSNVWHIAWISISILRKIATRKWIAKHQYIQKLKVFYEIYSFQELPHINLSKIENFIFTQPELACSKSAM